MVVRVFRRGRPAHHSALRPLGCARYCSARAAKGRRDLFRHRGLRPGRAVADHRARDGSGVLAARDAAWTCGPCVRPSRGGAVRARRTPTRRAHARSGNPDSAVVPRRGVENPVRVGDRNASAVFDGRRSLRPTACCKRFRRPAGRGRVGWRFGCDTRRLSTTEPRRPTRIQSRRPAPRSRRERSPVRGPENDSGLESGDGNIPRVWPVAQRRTGHERWDRRRRVRWPRPVARRRPQRRPRLARSGERRPRAWSCRVPIEQFALGPDGRWGVAVQRESSRKTGPATLSGSTSCVEPRRCSSTETV